MSNRARQQQQESIRPQERNDEMHRIGAATVVITRDDTPVGHAMLSLKIVTGVESYDDDYASLYRRPSNRSSQQKSHDIGGTANKTKTTKRKSKTSSAEKDLLVSRKLDTKRAVSIVSPGDATVNTEGAGSVDASFSANSHQFSLEPSLDPLNNFGPTKEQFGRPPATSLLGHDFSESDDGELFMDGKRDENFPNVTGTNGKVALPTCPAATNESISGKDESSSGRASAVVFERQAANNPPTQPILGERPPIISRVGSGGLVLKDTLPRHPRHRVVASSNSGIADWAKLMRETSHGHTEDSEAHDPSSTVGEDSVGASTVSSSSGLQRSSDGAFAQLDLGGSDGIRMISRQDTLEDDDSGLHRRKVLTELEKEVKPQNVMLTALKSLGSDIIKKTELSPPSLNKSTSQPDYRVDRGQSLRSMSTRKTAASTARRMGEAFSQGIRPIPRTMSNRPTLFSTKSSRNCKLVDDGDDETLNGLQP